MNVCYSIKKHYTTMTNEELAELHTRISNIKDFNYCSHSKQMMDKRVITREEVLNTINDFTIIEYHRKDNNNRVLLRGTKETNGSNICIILDLDNGDIVSCYKNGETDNHNTLNWDNYCDFSIIDCICSNKIIFTY